MKFLGLFFALFVIHSCAFTEGYPIVFVLCNPRSVSTACSRYFHERGDFEVLHEPYLQCFAYHNFGEAAFDTFDKAVFDATMTFDQLKDHILKTAEQKPVFIKDMVHGIYDTLTSDRDLIARKNVHFIFLIRDPAKSIISYYKKISQHYPWVIPHMPAVLCVDRQYELLQRVKDIKGCKPLVIDADDLVNDPHAILQIVCKAVQVPYKAEALNWSPKFLPQWESWGFQHDSVAKSSGFQKPKQIATKGDFQKIPEKDRAMVEKIYETQLPFYQKMYELRAR